MSIATSTGMNAASPPTMSRQKTHRLLLGLGLATAMQFYTYESVNLILPDMAGALGLSRDEASWILTVYSSALFFGVPFSTYLARRLGVLRYLIASVVVFCVASVGCAAAHRLDTMLIWSAVQGLAGAGLSVWWRASVYMLMPIFRNCWSCQYVSLAAKRSYYGFAVDCVTFSLQRFEHGFLALTPEPVSAGSPWDLPMQEA
jgi:DHA2 family multidrug resistance protein